MNDIELPIFRAPQGEKVKGFELVESFFLEVIEESPTTPLSHEDIFINSRGIFQALSLLIDFGHLNSANTFIKANPLILKMAFKLKKVVEDETGKKTVVAGYQEHSPLLLLAPYLIKKDLHESVVTLTRPLFFKYESIADMSTQYDRCELSDTLNLWFKLGMDVLSFSNEDTVSYSAISLAMDMRFSSTYMDKILKHTISSPMYDGEYKVSLCIDFLTSMSRAFSLESNSDTTDFNSMRYVALCANSYLKHGGETLFDKNDVAQGNFSKINVGLSPYIVNDVLITTGFIELSEILFVLLGGIDILKGPTVLQENAMRLVLEFSGLGPIDALSLVNNDNQRDILLDILKGS